MPAARAGRRPGSGPSAGLRPASRGRPGRARLRAGGGALDLPVVEVRGRLGHPGGLDEALVPAGGVRRHRRTRAGRGVLDQATGPSARGEPLSRARDHRGMGGLSSPSASASAVLAFVRAPGGHGGRRSVRRGRRDEGRGPLPGSLGGALKAWSTLRGARGEAPPWSPRLLDSGDALLKNRQGFASNASHSGRGGARMAQRPTFDMSKLTTADRILLGAGALFFIDTFLRWQKFFCIKSVFISGCATASAWNGNGGFAGVLAALFSLALIAWIVLHVAGVNLEFGVAASTIASVLVLGTVLFALIKFL